VDQGWDILVARLIVNQWGLVLDSTTVADVSGDENVGEVANVLLRGTTAKNDEAPRVERLRVGKQELLTTEVPTTLSARVELGSIKLDLRVGKNTGLSLQEVSKN
tara:strand:- start:2173 stop:2487 length:315 start_codon:yes stop_codon:yes gene_type:complete